MRKVWDAQRVVIDVPGYGCRREGTIQSILFLSLLVLKTGHYCFFLSKMRYRVYLFPLFLCSSNYMGNLISISSLELLGVNNNHNCHLA